MEAKNLRVTNFVNNDRVANAIIFIGYDSVELITPQGNNITARLELIKPIELCEKWLINLGFTKNGVLYEHGKFAIKEWQVGSDNQWQLFWGDCHIKQAINMKVHELQNLFFALTDTELSFEKRM